MTEPRLFEDDIDVDANGVVDRYATNDSNHRCRGIVWGGLAIGAIIVALGTGLGLKSNQPSPLILSGAKVGQLQRGAAIVLDGMPIGKVENVEIRNGLPSALLEIDPQFRDRISDSSRFEIGSLNQILPGNIGVKIKSSGQAGGNLSPASDLQTIRKRLADNSILPTYTPVGFYLVLVVVAVLGVLILRLVFKVLKSTWSVVAVVLVIVGLHSWYTGNLNINEMAHWAYERAKAVETRAEPLDLDVR